MLPKTFVSTWIPALHAGMTQSEGLLNDRSLSSLILQEFYCRPGGTMNNEVDVIAGVGLDRRTRKSHWPARLDWAQSASGLFLGLFMWGHMAFVSTILISKDAMWWVTKMFEGYFFFGR